MTGYIFIYLIFVVFVAGANAQRELYEDCGKAPGFRESKSNRDAYIVDKQGIKRMVNGYTIEERSQFPQFVGVVANLGFGIGQCSGVLMAPDVVITAGHCIYRKRQVAKMVKVGNSLHSIEEYKSKGVQTIDASTWCLNRYYDENVVSHDSSIIILEKPIDMNRDNQAACLPSGRYKGECFMLGIGLSNGVNGDLPPVRPKKMQYLPVKYSPDCQAAGDNTQACYTPSRKERFGMPCVGDSGGPILCKVNKVWEVHGLVSKGSTEKCNMHAAQNHYKNDIYYDVSNMKEEMFELVQACRKENDNYRSRSLHHKRSHLFHHVGHKPRH